MKKLIFIASLFFLFTTVSVVSGQPVASAGNGFLASEPILASEPFLPDQPSVATMPFLLPDSDPFATSLRIISALFAVIIIALILSWVIQKKGGFGNNVFGKVIGILPLDNRRFIYLVDVVGRVLVLGVTESNINLLCEITDKDTVDSLRLQGSTPVLPGMEKLFSFLRKAKTENDGAGNENPEINNIEIQATTEKNQQRLKKLNSLLIRRNQDKEE